MHKNCIDFDFIDVYLKMRLSKLKISHLRIDSFQRNSVSSIDNRLFLLQDARKDEHNNRRQPITLNSYPSIHYSTWIPAWLTYNGITLRILPSIYSNSTSSSVVWTKRYWPLHMPFRSRVVCENKFHHLAENQTRSRFSDKTSHTCGNIRGG